MKYEILGVGFLALLLSAGLDYSRRWFGFIPEQIGVVMFWIALGFFVIYGIVALVMSLKKFGREMKS